MLIRNLFLTFLKIGAFTFGGGYAMIPLIKREVVENKKWLNEQEVFDIIAISESTPGPLAVNAATFVGSRMMGMKGALAATLGVITPSFLIVVLISQMLLQIENFPVVQNAFLGIRAGVLVLIANAWLSLFKKMKKEVSTYALLAVALLLIWIFKIDTIIVLLVCAGAGVLWSIIIERRGQK